MGIWIFMLFIDLLFPLTMVCLGKLFMNKPPKNINPLFGYRTPMSTKSKDTWEFAHKYLGKLWFKWGLVILPLSVISLILVINKEADVIETAGGIICTVQLIPLIGSIFPTEAALKKNFDKNGIRR